MRLDRPEQATLKALDEATLGVLTDVLYFVQHLRKLDDIEWAVGNTLRAQVYDPLNRHSPEYFATHIDIALNSNALLSARYPGFPHSEERTRLYLKRLAERIRDGSSIPKLKLDDTATLSDDVPSWILDLLTPLEPRTFSESEKEAIAKSIFHKLPGGREDIFEVTCAIRNMILSEVRLTRMAPPGWTEEGVREYLRSIGLVLERIWSAGTGHAD